jgi:TPR repeat protein
MLLLDACRNNPFGGRGLRATGGGLALMQAPEGTIISYATQPGNIALDGSNGDSPYTLALVDTIKRPGLGLFEAFNEIGLAVKRATGGAQQPWVSSSPIAGGFYFAGSAADRPAAQAVAAPIEPETITAASLDRATAKATPRDTMVAALTPPPLVNRTEAPVEACDRLAAPPLDRPAPIGGVEFDDLDAVKAVPACRAAVAAQPDNPRLVFELVRSLLKNGDEAEVNAMFRDAAVAGHAAAMNSLAIAYENGRGLPGDIVQAARWYAKSADAGNSAAMIRLGWLYENGRGVPIDAGEALRWFRRSAEVGNAAGMVAVGEAYDKGLGAPKDPIEAARWFAKAAEVGNAAGMNHLGFAYLGGIGVGRDPIEAVRWFRRAADAGNKQAMQRLGDAYAGGVGVGLDKTEAERWYRKARE